MRILREQVRGGAGDGAYGWTADRGLVFTSGDRRGEPPPGLPEREEHALFLPAMGPYRVLAGPAAPATPGAGARELLGYGDREEPFEVTVALTDALARRRRRARSGGGRPSSSCAGGGSSA